MIFNWGKNKALPLPISWDLHNHLLFGIDDGSENLEMTLEMAKLYVSHGVNRITATPHIISGYYPNTFETISEKCERVKNAFIENNIPIELDFAAEYYVDDTFVEKIHNNEKLLTFKGNHILIETAFMNKPHNLHEIIFALFSKGYQPVFAHPERYLYLIGNLNEAEQIFETGIKFQINLLSLVGYYSKASQTLAKELIEAGMYHFFATDAHRPRHLELLDSVCKSKLLNKIDWNKVENSKE